MYCFYSRGFSVGVFRRILFIENYTDLSNCKKLNTSDGKIDWRNSVGSIIPFYYNNYKGNIEILQYIKEQKKVKILYDNEEYTVSTSCILHARLKTLFLNKKYIYTFKYNIGDVVNNKKITNRYLEENKWYTERMYTIECLICGKVSNVKERNITKNKGCRFCYGEPLKCIYVEYPEFKKYFQEKDLHYFYEKTTGSGLELEFICPNCGTKKTYSICNLLRFGFSCNKCSDGISAGEKFFISLLNQLNIQYDYQFSFEDKYIFEDNSTYTPYYDFAIHNNKTIVEIDGEQHYKDNIFFIGNTQKELDEIKTNFAESHGYKIIRLKYTSKASKDRFNKLIEEIENNLSSLFSLETVDYEKCKLDAVHSKMIEAINLWNLGYSNSEIAQKINVCTDTIRKYLNEGNEIGLCENYSKHEVLSRGQQYWRKNKKVS